MSDPRPTLPQYPDDSQMESLAGSLDGLGDALAAREIDEPPTALIAAMRARAVRRTLVRWATLASVAAALLLAALAFSMTRPAALPPRPTIVQDTPPSISPPSMTQPTMATLRSLNQNATPETLRLPSGFSGSAPAVTMSPRDARTPESVARALGTFR